MVKEASCSESEDEDEEDEDDGEDEEEDEEDGEEGQHALYQSTTDNSTNRIATNTT